MLVRKGSIYKITDSDGADMRAEGLQAGFSPRPAVSRTALSIGQATKQVFLSSIQKYSVLAWLLVFSVSGAFLLAPGNCDGSERLYEFFVHPTPPLIFLFVCRCGLSFVSF